MSLLLNMLSRLVITFPSRSKCLLISWLKSPSAVILEPKNIKSDTVSTVSHLFPMKWWDRIPWSLFSECWVLSQLFRSSLSLFSLQFSSVAQSWPILRPHESQHARPPCPSPTPGVHSRLMSIVSVMPSSHLILGRPLLLLPPVPPSLFQWVNCSHEVAKVLEFQL